MPIAAFALWAAPGASAATLFADPAGSASGTCEPPDPPCTLQRAVEVEAGNGDEVVLNPGTYVEGANEVTINVAIDLHGAANQTRPTITSTAAGPAVDVDAAGTVVRDLRIEHSMGTNGVALDIQAPATAERVVATSSAHVACLPALDAVIRDSVCTSTAPTGGAAVRFFSSTATSTATLINVSAVATAGNTSAIDLQDGDAAQLTLNAINVIASGSGTAAPPRRRGPSRSTWIIRTTTPSSNPVRARRSPIRASVPIRSRHRSSQAPGSATSTSWPAHPPSTLAPPAPASAAPTSMAIRAAWAPPPTSAPTSSSPPQRLPRAATHSRPTPGSARAPRRRPSSATSSSSSAAASLA